MNEPIVRPSDTQRARRLHGALRAQAELEEFARLVRDLRALQNLYKRFTRDIFCGKTLILQEEVDNRVKSILNPES